MRIREEVCQVARENDDTADPERPSTGANSPSAWEAKTTSWEGRPVMVSRSLIAMTVGRWWRNVGEEG